MSITYLEPGGETSCATGEVTVRALAVRGLDGLRLTLSLPDGVPFSGPSIVRPDRVVLPVLAGRIDVTVTTETADAAFGPDARVRLLVDVVSADGGFDQVQSPEIDLSGLPGTPVLRIDATRPGLLTIRSIDLNESTSPLTKPESVVPSGNSVAAVDSITESPLVRLARSESRARVAAVRAPEEQLRAFSVVLDRSASMVPHFRSGAITGVLSALVGLWQVFGADAGLPVWSGGLPARTYSADLAQESLADLLAEIYEVPDSGFWLAPVLARLPGSGPRTVFVITDDCPPDLPEIAEADLVGADTQCCCHLVVFGDEPTPNQRQNVLFTAVSATERESVVESLSRAPEMRAMVAALVRGSTR
ncbi:MAG TPA: hypothetical protein VLL08_05900 [Kineosporiaceae bacterium]|nr:hypothetical protein [Kineosporiaceae bacterium]